MFWNTLLNSFVVCLSHQGFKHPEGNFGLFLLTISSDLHKKLAISSKCQKSHMYYPDERIKSDWIKTINNYSLSILLHSLTVWIILQFSLFPIYEYIYTFQMDLDNIKDKNKGFEVRITEVKTQICLLLNTISGKLITVSILKGSLYLMNKF